ncbi:MAG: divalent-cation tolerance protein CutA [Verrucomicrobiales bacterium]|nr:divalent-cation tolerance protein CutA [Verrucomicrobiales bacterium]
MNVLMVQCVFPVDFPLHALAGEIVELGLAACCQVGAPMTSFYRWEGRTETAGEVTLTCKTTVACWPGLRDFLLKRHSYQVPEILALPVRAGNAGYLEWVEAACSAGAPEEPGKPLT